MAVELNYSFLINFIKIFILIKVFKWLFNYIYQLWVYSHISGPPIIPFLGNFLRLRSSKSDIFYEYFKIIDEYGKGKFLRIWVGTLPVVLFHKPDELEILFNDSKFINKSFEYKLLYPWLKTGLLTSGGTKWQQRRKLITPSFHFDILKDFLIIINEHAEIFIDLLKKKINKNDKIVLKPFISACSLDIICETAMGVNINAQTDENSKYVQTVQRMCDLLVDRMKTPYLWPEFIFRFTDCYKGQKECLEILHGFTKKIVKERSDEFSGLSVNNNKRIAFLDTLLNERLKDPNSISVEGIQEEVDTFMFEGHDTTTSAIDWACFALGTHIDEQKKIHDEIDIIFGDSRRPITQDDLNKMVYLECAIKESLRLYPPVPYVAREPIEDSIIDGKKILKGACTSISIYKIHRDERYYPDPEAYKPERFLPQNSENRHPYAFIPFSAGRRNCVGQRFAMLEIKIILANILRNFTIKCDQTFEELKPYSYLILRAENPIAVKLEERR